MKFRQIIGLLVPALAFFSSYVDRLSWPPMMPLVTADIPMSATQAGSYMSAFFMGYVISQLPGGLLTDRFGYRKIILASFLIMGFFTSLMGFIHSYEMGLLFRVLAGMGSGAIFSAGSRSIFDWYTEKNRVTAMGIFSASTTVALTAVNLLVPFFARNYDWRTAFFVCGILPLAGFAIGLFFLKERTPQAQKAAPGASAPTNTVASIITLCKNHDLMLAALTGFLAIWATTGIASWTNAYLVKQLHMSVVDAGYIMSLYGIGASFSMPIAGFITDRLRIRRKMMIAIALILLAPALIIFGLNTSTAIMYVFGPLLGLLALAYYPVLMTVIGESVPEDQIGTALGVSNTIWQLGALLSPLVVGLVIDSTQSYSYAFPTLAIGPAIACFIILLTKGEKADRAMDARPRSI